MPVRNADIAAVFDEIADLVEVSACLQLHQILNFRCCWRRRDA